MHSENKSLFYVIFASIALFALRLTYVHFGPIDLSPDEAHYWEWSRYMDWSYYSKPPMVAWLNGISTSILGHTHVGVRFFSVLILSILTVLAFLIGKRVTGSDCAGVFAAILFAVTPEFSAGGLLMTPDVPSLLFWALSIYVLLGIDFSKKPTKEHLKTFVLLGVLIGLAGLSKYTAAVFYPLLGFYLVVDKQRRPWLCHPYIYMAGLISLSFQAPVFYWNAMNDWVTFKHVLGQNTVSNNFSGVKSIGNFLGGQLGVVGPIIFLMMMWVFLRLPKYNYSNAQMAARMHMLWWFTAPLFLAFLLKSLDAKVQPNWPVFSIWGGLILLACWVGYESKLRKRIFMVGMAMSLALTVVSYDTFILRTAGVEIPFKKDPLKPVFGWRGLGHALSQLAETVGGDKVILTTRYQTTSELAFYMKDNPYVMYLNLGNARQNQYDLWAWPDLSNKIVLYVRERTAGIDPQISQAFQSCIYVGSVVSQRDAVNMRAAYMYACAGYKGLNRNKPEKY